MKFSLISSTKKHLDLDNVIWVTLPTPTGEIGIYPGHTPLVGALKPGILKVDTNDGVQTFAIGGGVFETDGTHLEVLADMVDTGEEATAEDVAKKKQEASKLMQEAEKK